jgi:hypothetical protein
VNRGDAPTTINSVAIMHFSSRWRMRRLRPDSPAFVVNDYGLAPRLPLALKPGEEWRGMPPQDEFVLAAKAHNWNRYVYVAVYHTMAAKPVLARLTMPIGGGTPRG